MKLVAEMLTGSLFNVEVGEDATVGDLKKQIGSQENLPTERLILMLDLGGDCDRPLLDKDEAPIRDYGVRDGSHIYIFFKPLDDDASIPPPWDPQVFDLIEPSFPIPLDYFDEFINDSIDPSIYDFDKVPTHIEPSNKASNEADDQPSPSVDSSSDQPEE